MAGKELAVVRGAGDIATGVIQKFVRAGFDVLALEVPYPTAVRRSVALCEAVYEGEKQVEDVRAVLVRTGREMRACFAAGEVPILVDPEGEAIARLRPRVVVDAILAKRNLGTHRGMAPLTIALGPGFEAGRDVDAVIETMRGHDLGRLILHGAALPNTGVPGEIGGVAEERVVHAPEGGEVRPIKNLGEVVHKGEAILLVGQRMVLAPTGGVLRGLIRPGLVVSAGMKIADIDPRSGVNIHTISDKARNVGGGALEAYYYLSRMKAEALR